ncbi:unnamed protein product [Gadus morhua 'NCC']
MASVQLGDSVALQYSITSQRTDHSNQCKESCVYTLPKNNINSSDAGTYYCALAACGEVVFGSGTTLDITDLTHETWSTRPGPRDLVHETQSTRPSPRDLTHETQSTRPDPPDLVHETWSTRPDPPDLVHQT